MFAGPPRRARTFDELIALMDRMLPEAEAMAAMAAYRPRPGDVIISPFAKCGTTWLQQSLHALRTGGDMDFPDISSVIPWIETSVSLDIDLEAPQRAEPRAFKSHLPYGALPKGVRYVVSLRDPKDAFVSYFKFFEGWFIEPGEGAMDAVARRWMADPGGRPGSYWNHLVSWWEQRDNPDVLLTTYELMTRTPREHLVRLAAFSGLEVDGDRIDLALHQSSLPFMLAHKDRFDEVLMRDLSERRCGLPPGSDSAKVRQGGVGGHKQALPPELAARIDDIWAEHVAPRIGFKSYSDLAAAIEARWTNENGDGLSTVPAEVQTA